MAVYNAMCKKHALADLGHEFLTRVGAKQGVGPCRQSLTSYGLLHQRPVYLNLDRWLSNVKELRVCRFEVSPSMFGSDHRAVKITVEVACEDSCYSQ